VLRKFILAHQNEKKNTNINESIMEKDKFLSIRIKNNGKQGTLLLMHANAKYGKNPTSH
jgi:hypothetical protein